MKFATWENFNPSEHNSDIVVIADELPLHKKLQIKRKIENLSQQRLAEILNLEHAPRICAIESGKVPLETGDKPHIQIERIKKYLYEEDYSDGKMVE